MFHFIAARFLQSILVIVCVYSATFWLLMASPGDPFLGDKKPTEAARKALEEKYLINNPPRAFLAYAWRPVFTGDFGPTVSLPNFTVRDVIGSALPVSISLGAFALLIALCCGVLTGTVGAVYKGRWPDIFLTVTTLLGVSLPTFVIGALLLMALAAGLTILPAGGWGTLRQIILPAVTLSVLYLAYIARLTRASVLDVISADFVRTARAKGLPTTTIIGSHVLRNASLPVLSFLGPAAATVLTGSFVVEKLFAIPGLGSHFVDACLYPDIPLVLGTVMVYTVIIVFFNFLIDIALTLADPRIALR